MLFKGIKPFSVLFCLLFILSSAELFAQHQGIGLRLGEPLGITYKRYLPGNRAVEFGLGTAPKDWSKNYYTNSFEDRYEDYDVINHDVNSVVYLTGRYLFHYPLSTEGIEGKFTWYWGPGVLLKTARVEYRYRLEDRSDNRIHEKNRTDVDFGPELIAGLEYTFEDAPISIFTDLELLLELTDRTTFRLLAGVGARFNF